MSQFRKTEIASQLNEWLFSGRYNPPKDFRGNEKAEKAEAEALLGVLLKFAPPKEPAAFVSRVLDQLEYQLKFRLWPNKQEIGAVCANITKDQPKGEQASLQRDMRDIAINSRRMARGEAVGEGYLWGRMAVEMIAERLVDEKTMTAYRSAAFFARRDTYGEQAALKWEAEAKERHAAAKRIWGERGQEKTHRDVSVPDKRLPNDIAPIYEPVVEETPKAEHWTQTADPEDPRWQALKQSRRASGITKE